MNNVAIGFEIDEEKAIKISKILYKQFKNREGIFASYSMPEYIYPRSLIPGSDLLPRLRGFHRKLERLGSVQDKALP
ncbi:MAG: hypothetical protein ACTSR0_03885, partial [Candidatus Asgardarchaeia archaeon]